MVFDIIRRNGGAHGMCLEMARWLALQLPADSDVCGARSGLVTLSRTWSHQSGDIWVTFRARLAGALGPSGNSSLAASALAGGSGSVKPGQTIRVYVRPHPGLLPQEKGNLRQPRPKTSAHWRLEVGGWGLTFGASAPVAVRRAQSHSVVPGQTSLWDVPMAMKEGKRTESPIANSR